MIKIKDIATKEQWKFIKEYMGLKKAKNLYLHEYNNLRTTWADLPLLCK